MPFEPPAIANIHAADTDTEISPPRCFKQIFMGRSAESRTASNRIRQSYVTVDRFSRIVHSDPRTEPN